jgi:hypothetical protein
MNLGAFVMKYLALIAFVATPSLPQDYFLIEAAFQ